MPDQSLIDSNPAEWQAYQEYDSIVRLKRGRPPKPKSILVTLPAVSQRFTASRKAAVLSAIDYGQVTREEVMVRYSLSAEELDTWVARRGTYSVRGLRAKMQQGIERRRRPPVRPDQVV